MSSPGYCGHRPRQVSVLLCPPPQSAAGCPNDFIAQSPTLSPVHRLSAAPHCSMSATTHRRVPTMPSSITIRGQPPRTIVMSPNILAVEPPSPTTTPA
ncbi:hypothetical protein E2562_034061 [Oryza meyeriana var. granulata]|uniref:Uncharacterized protein n=1 Tax=Oryza meyeriana var. granulata TaxID=110450 RepID=A0A6G1DU04_9ORYZ|nr:hypothetical protein E2562_034061 [Oryza meyeriana var. granulata]